MFLTTCLLAIVGTAQDKPNFIVIFTDDQGYNDLGCFGSKNIKTPNIDRMANEGRKYTSFYVPCSVCSPSRAALLTGCYPKRVGMHKHVLFPKSNYGLNPKEHTIADQLKSIGYATACVGKWHLGHHPETLPRANGFDSYFGIPYSNDMNHPDNKRISKLGSDALWADQKTAVTDWNTPLIRNEEIVELPVDQRTVTRRYTDEAISFVKSNKDKPFFLYLPHSMPHIPLYVPDDVYDADPANAYKCVIEHIDAEVGRLVQTVRDLGLSENTYIIYTSDNGPWLRFKNHGGCADPLREGKSTTFEGGQRVPCVMWGPGRIPAGTSTDAFTSTMDLLPTIAAITKSTLPDMKIDGQDISATFTSDATTRDELIYYSPNGFLQGIRKGDWKYLEMTPRRRRNQPKPKTTTYLFNLADDIGEQTNLLDSNPEIATKLKARMIEADMEISDNARPVWRKAKPDKKVSSSPDLKIEFGKVAKKSVFVSETHSIWGGSVVKGDDGLYHMFYARWPKELGWAWVTDSEIAHAVAKTPFGPFKFKDVALERRGREHWDG
jgi:arylsulfatase A-like enzyme